MLTTTLSARQGLSRLSMRNRSRIDTPVDLGKKICVANLGEIRGVVDWSTSIPLHTPPACLVTNDPSVELIELDLTLLVRLMVTCLTEERWKEIWWMASWRVQA